MLVYQRVFKTIIVMWVYAQNCTMRSPLGQTRPDGLFHQISENPLAAHRAKQKLFDQMSMDINQMCLTVTSRSFLLKFPF